MVVWAQPFVCSCVVYVKSVPRGLSDPSAAGDGKLGGVVWLLGRICLWLVESFAADDGKLGAVEAEVQAKVGRLLLLWCCCCALLCCSRILFLVVCFFAKLK
jgi:hypothetical protein